MNAVFFLSIMVLNYVCTKFDINSTLSHYYFIRIVVNGCCGK
ncbi:hypothetical protein [Vibrio gallaecicus]|nr:hypothetical protein [Vibrio gallaecicus]MDN3616322.1 hypothetical protein [Vibrio gallaecicus]